MKFKDESISLQSLCPQIVLALIVIDGIMINHGKEVMITSANDAKHSPRSSHYRGMAVDIRSNWFDNKQAVLLDCRAALGNSPDFDLLLEGLHEDWEHFHLQYLPKRRENG